MHPTTITSDVSSTNASSSNCHYGFVVMETGRPGHCSPAQYTTMDLWLGRLAGPGHPLDTPRTPRTAHASLLSSDRFARSSWTNIGFCHLLPGMWPGLPHSPHRQRNSTQDQRSYARTLCHPVSGWSVTPPLHTTAHQDCDMETAPHALRAWSQVRIAHPTQENLG